MKILLFALVVTSVLFACGGRCADSSCPPADVAQACSDLIEAICTRRVACGTVKDFATCEDTMGQLAQCANSSCESGTSFSQSTYQSCHDLVVVGDCTSALIAQGQLNVGSVGCGNPFCN
jgi:hypothetical protein